MRSTKTLAEGEADGLKFAEQKGATSLAALRATTWQELTAPNPGAGPTTGLRFSPIADGYFLPAPVHEVVKAGRHNDVPRSPASTPTSWSVSWGREAP